MVERECGKTTMNSIKPEPITRLVETDNAKFSRLGLDDIEMPQENVNVNMLSIKIPPHRGSEVCSDMNNSPKMQGYHVPTEIITRRTRTNSTYERALNFPIERGTIKYFCRTKGHGFVERDNGEQIFLHISDIEDQYIPLEGDICTFRVCPIPPKLTNFQAIHVNIINYSPHMHKRWDSPIIETELRSCDGVPNNLVT